MASAMLHAPSKARDSPSPGYESECQSVTRYSFVRTTGARTGQCIAPCRSTVLAPDSPNLETSAVLFKAFAVTNLTVPSGVDHHLERGPRWNLSAAHPSPPAWTLSLLR